MAGIYAIVHVLCCVLGSAESPVLVNPPPFPPPLPPPQARFVVGIIHTNYKFYARTDSGGVVKKPIVAAACAFTVRAHCHRIIKLSGALQDYAKEKELVENVHGVSMFLGKGAWGGG